MKRNKALSTVLALVLVLGVVFTGCSSQKSKNGKSNEAVGNFGNSVASSGTLTIWSSADELNTFAKDFMAVHPGIKINVTVIPNGDFLTKLNPAMQGGQGAPDMFTGESAYVRYLVDMPYWDDLSAAPYNAGDLTKNMWSFVVDAGKDSKGKQRALSWQACAGSVFYRTDLAKQYLGADTPDAVSKLFDNYDDMLKAAQTLKEKSNGSVKLFSSWQDLFNMQFSNRKQPWVVKNKFTIDQSMLDFYEVAKKISTSGYDMNADPWTPAWTAGVDAGNTLTYVLPTWGLESVIVPNAKTSEGKWGIANGPLPYYMGGTWLGIYSGSKNKNLAWQFLKFVCTDQNEAEKYSKASGDYVANKNADEALAKEPGLPVLGGQNPYQYYNAQMKNLKTGDLMTQYDQQIDNAYLTSIKSYIGGKASKDAAIKQFKDDVRNAYPNISVD